MRYPLWVFYLALPVGMGLMSARYLKRFYRLVFKFTPTELIAEHEMSRASHKQQDPKDNPLGEKANPT